MNAAATPSPHSRRPLRATTAATGLAVAATLGAPLLLELSRFGTHPYAVLPLPVLLLFGTLFSGALVDVLAPLPRRRAVAALLAASVAGGVVAWLAPFATPRDALAPAATTLVAAALLFGAPHRGRMLAAMVVYAGCTLLANYTFDSFLPLGPFVLVNVGTLFFGVTFTQRDRVHRYGRRNVYGMIAASAVANVALATGLGTPLRYVGVSFLAILLSETADTEIYQRLLHRRWLTRVASSNGVSAPLDTLIFTLLAFAGQDFATPSWLARVIATDVAVKYTSSLVAAVGLNALPSALARRVRGGPDPETT